MNRCRFSMSGCRALGVLVSLCAWAGIAQAGPLFDDYLNYVRPGPGTGPGDAQVEVAAGQPVGQSFSVPKGVGEIYRIGLRPVYDTWTTGEEVLLTLYDNPRRGKPLANYTIGQATSRVQAIHDTKDFVLWFQLRAQVDNAKVMCFDVQVRGGDGRVSFAAKKGKGLAGGQAMGVPAGIQDLAFEIHIKPVADAEANLRAFFNERVNLDHPALTQVKTAVAGNDWQQAIHELARHFHGRMDVWGAYKDLMQPSPKPDADTAHADLVMKGFLKHHESGEPVPWRAESYWMPEYDTDRAQRKHAVDPSLYHWHMDRLLGGTWTDTGRADYARKAIDLRMQFILDNPNPKISKLPQYFELWNDRTAAGRAPGHGVLAYARLCNAPDFTDDERLVFMAFLEDNAFWTYRAESGANWGAEAARSCYEFGLTFPEWKRSPEYVRWGVQRLAEIVMGDVRGDGTSTEAAIKYHNMVARRLKGLVEDVRKHNLDVDAELQRQLTGVVERMYEHAAYTLMPNGFVVMGGDSWYENLCYRAGSRIEEVRDPAGLLSKIQDADDAISRCLREALSADTRAALAKVNPDAGPDDALVQQVVSELNARIIGGALLCSATDWAKLDLDDVTRQRLANLPQGQPLADLNYRLLEFAFPQELGKDYASSELASAGELLNRPDFVWIVSQGRSGTPPSRISKVFPEAGYFIMRSDFGQGGQPFADARQLFIHNGMWFGSHGHFDLLSVNLYAYGRPLIIDPGQYDHQPPPGIDRYWQSSIHSMLVLDGRDVKREPGPSRWATNGVIDWLDGRHHGYNAHGEIEHVRRRILFARPDYYVIDDNIAGRHDGAWAQAWNLADPQAQVDPDTRAIRTTFADGGNVLILNQDPGRLSIETAPGITAAGSEIPHTRIIRLGEHTDSPRFQTLVYPYPGSEPPTINWQRLAPEGKDPRGLDYALLIESGGRRDWIALSGTGEPLTFDGGKDRMVAEAAFVRQNADGQVESFAWVTGRELQRAGRVLARSEQTVHQLGVRYVGDTLHIEARESMPSLAVDAGGLSRVTLNGQPLPEPVMREGHCYPFADQPDCIYADDADGFKTITETNEWERHPDPAAWGAGYLHHETDPGRHETGDYLFDVPKAGRYLIEVHVPAVTKRATDATAYRIDAGGKPAEAGGPIAQVRRSGRSHLLTVDHRIGAGWVALGEFALRRGRFKVNARNMTETDGLYFIADAMRLVPLAGDVPAQ